MSKIEFGISMLHCLGEPFKKMITYLESIDIKLIELVDDGFHTLNKKNVSILKDISNSYDLTFTIHSPFADINIASPSKSIRTLMINRLKRSMLYANDLNAKLWVLHPGNKTGISMFYPGEDWKQNLKSINLLNNLAYDFGLKIAIENLPGKYGFIMKTPEDFIRFYKESSLEDIGIVLDTGHSNLENQTETFLRKLPNKIVHIHISDNMGQDDQHLGMGYGKIDWNQFVRTLREINYKKTIMIEAVEHLQESLDKIKLMLS